MDIDMKILVAEDDFIASTVLCKFLQKYGEVDITENGKEALDLFRKGLQNGPLYDLVCLDIMMPKLNGHETLKAMREAEDLVTPDKPPCKIIMTTALDDSENILKSFENRCNGYITKPYSFEKLQTQINKVFSGKQA